MNAAEILFDLRSAGIEPKLLDGDRLGFPPGALTDAQRQAIRAAKAELVAIVKRQVANDPLIDPADARQAAAYYGHHFGCRFCIAAGRGSMYGQRCKTGLSLWEAFQPN